MTSPLIIKPLAKHHVHQGSTCSNATLDDYIRKQVGQDVRRGYCKAFVAVTDNTPTTLLGNYTLSTLSIDLDKVPPSLTKGLPRLPMSQPS